MKERFQNLEPGDIILTTWEDTKQTVPYLVMYDGTWNLICLSSGEFMCSLKSKKSLCELVGEYVIDIVPRQIAINRANAQLGGRFKYPIMARDNLCYVRQEREW